MTAPKMLRGLSEIRQHFYRDERPTYFICVTNFNLMGMDEWVRNFRFIAYADCFDGAHPHVFVPRQHPHEPFQTLEEINDYLLLHPEVREFLKRRGLPARAVFLMFDERAEALCAELGLEILLPSARLRATVDDKVQATRIAARAGVASVPNVLGRVDSYARLRELAAELGPDLVIQTPFGDSGMTTFFVSSEEDYRRHAREIEREGEVKVMRRIRCRGSAIEACVTRHGTIVGPLMTELIGFPELTPYRGGWCGNEAAAGAFTAETRARAADKTFRVGEELRQLGYRGYFEIDYLTDLDTGELYLGEINPRITGASSMTNLAAFAHADAPLFLFHLLEFEEGVDFELDIPALNRRWADPENIDDWSQMIVKHLVEEAQTVTEAPRTGVWRMRPDGAIEYGHMQTHRRTVDGDDEAFWLRIAGKGDVLTQGEDLGILVLRGRLMTPGGELTERGRRWVAAIRSHFRGKPYES